MCVCGVVDGRSSVVDRRFASRRLTAPAASRLQRPQRVDRHAARPAVPPHGSKHAAPAGVPHQVPQLPALRRGAGALSHAAHLQLPRQRHVQGQGRRLTTPPPIAERSIVMSVSVCLCVCLSASISPELHVRSSPTFFCTLPMAVARSSSGGVVIRYVLPVLWMTSYLLISQGCSTSPPS